METPPPTTADQSYTVVARRYRPKSFTELIGQDHIAQALSKAIATGRVGHAYLFTGARGVGKTSTARIFAKALNVGESAEDLTSDIAQAIDSGDDMDVIEIDGASNRGIEEIRQLRANVNVRPSRARYKIYIIDEVHMLTSQAFNALLKTLEEPPTHVKFVFCTTDPDKIPITVLSRCQRFDFAPVKFDAIQLRLKEISIAEGFTVDDEALALLARRAAGSMRDSQSLLEQVMSFSTDTITVEQVHALLGTADEGRLLALAQSLCDADALAAIDLVDESTRAGADPGQLAEQLLNYLRDIMTAGIGGSPQLLKLANPIGHQNLKELADSWGVQSILSAIQILDESLVRMRTSVSATTLLEVSMVQICQLEKLASIPALLEAVMQGPNAPARTLPPATAEKKNAKPRATEKNGQLSRGAETPSQNVEPVVKPVAQASQVREAKGTETEASNTDHGSPKKAEVVPAATYFQAASPQAATAVLPASETAVLTAPATVPAPSRPTAPASNREESSRSGASPEALASWRRALASIDGMLADFAGLAVAVEPRSSDQWNIVFPPGATKPSEYCEIAQRRAELQAAVESTLGRKIQLSFTVMTGDLQKPAMATPQAAIRAQKIREMAEHPYIKKVCDVLDGEILRVDPPREFSAANAPTPSASAPTAGAKPSLS